MALSNAERQARWRARQQEELAALRHATAAAMPAQPAPGGDDEPLRNLSRGVTDDGELALLLLEQFGEARMLELAPRFFQQPFDTQRGAGPNPIGKLVAALGKFTSTPDIDDIPERARRALARSCLRALNLDIGALQPRESRFDCWERLVSELTDLQEGMQESLDNMPENFQQGEQAQRLEEYISIDLSQLSI